VVAANWLYLAGLTGILDPMMSMEPFYIDMAQRPVSRILTENPAWGPLYALWLKPWVAVLHDPVAVYTANLYALSFGVSVLIYVYLLLLTRRATVGLGAALFFLVSDLNVPLYSKVSGFALMMVLAGFTVSEAMPAGGPRMTAAATGMVFAAYARPEFYPAGLGLCLVALWRAGSAVGAAGRRILLWPVTLLAFILFLALGTGAPIFSPGRDNSRSFMAFREHFAWNWTRWHDQGRDFSSIWQQEFGGARTLLRAFLNNPGAVLHHLLDNFLGTVRFMAGAAFDHYPVLAPATSPALVRTENLLVSAAVFGSLVLVVVRPRLRRAMADRYGHVLLPYAALAMCSLVAATVIYPCTYYLIIPGVLLTLAAALAATLIFPVGSDFSGRARVGAVLACLAAIPKPFVLPSAYVVADSPFIARIAVARTITDTMGLIRSLGLPPPVHVLTFSDGIGAMLGAGFHEVKVWEKGDQPLEPFLRDNHVDVIVNLEAGRDSFAIGDPYWRLIQMRPEAAGFTRVSVPNHEDVRVYVRADLTEAGPGMPSQEGNGDRGRP